MPWSTSGTWTNEAAKTVTAVASVTGGIRVTAAAHGYADGDFVELVDLGGYNGAYFVSNVATDTFDVVNQYKQEAITGRTLSVMWQQIPSMLLTSTSKMERYFPLALLILELPSVGQRILAVSLP